MQRTRPLAPHSRDFRPTRTAAPLSAQSGSPDAAQRDNEAIMPKRLYKFTKADFALCALRHRQLKISTIDDLNDPFDLCAVDITDPLVNASLELHINNFRAKHGMLCFCRNWDNLLLWSHYGDGHAGICLGFDPPEKNAYEMEVQYQPNVIQIADVEEIDEHFMERLLRTKHESWSYEQESRMFIDVNDPPDENGLKFFKFAPHLTLREVIFGVNCEPQHFQPTIALLKNFPGVTPAWAYMRRDSFLLVRRNEQPEWSS